MSYHFLMYLWMFSVCGIDLYTDYYQIEKRNNYINHSLSLILPVVELALGLFLFGWVFFDLGWTYVIDAVIVMIVAYPGCRWFIHSNGLNWLRSKDKDYTGTGFGEDDAKTDEFLAKFKRRTGLSPTALRILVMSVSIQISIILILTNHFF